MPFLSVGRLRRLLFARAAVRVSPNRGDARLAARQQIEAGLIRMGNERASTPGRAGAPGGRQISDNDTLFVLAAAYGDTDEAVADYEAVKQLYAAVKTSREFDAAVIAKDADGDVRIVKKHEPTRHGAAVGLGWGLAAGVAAALFPPIGILGALAVGGGGGAAIGAVAGHAAGGVNRSDLKELGDTLDAGTAGLIVVYEMNLADQVAANIKAANRVVSKATDMAAGKLATDLNKAQGSAGTEPATA